MFRIVQEALTNDSEIALKYLSEIVDGLGWYVNTFDSGEAVLSYLHARTERKLPDVVVLDWKMPGLDGLATTRAIRESMATRQR